MEEKIRFLSILRSHMLERVEITVRKDGGAIQKDIVNRQLVVEG